MATRFERRATERYSFLRTERMWVAGKEKKRNSPGEKAIFFETIEFERTRCSRREYIFPMPVTTGGKATEKKKSR